jgi:plasmid stabilization system protein ParE
LLPVQWLISARNDLAAIIEYIAERNDVAVRDLQEDIERAASTFRAMTRLQETKAWK